MDENKIVNVLKNSAPRHWFISVIGIISILSVLFFGVSFGWIFASLQDWPDFVIDIVVTVVLFITLANIIAWNLWGREIIVMYGDRIVVKRKRLITLTKTYFFSELDLVEYRPFESTDAASRWGRRFGHKDGMVHIVCLERNEYLGIGMRRADAENLVDEIQKKCDAAEDCTQ